MTIIRKISKLYSYCVEHCTIRLKKARRVLDLKEYPVTWQTPGSRLDSASERHKRSRRTTTTGNRGLQTSESGIGYSFLNLLRNVDRCGNLLGLTMDPSEWSQ